PPGSPATTMKSLDQIEPRTPISSVPTNITVAGSYYFTTNLTCSTCTTGQHGILISTGNVSVDLNGFTLAGIAGSGSGVADGGVARSNLWVRNGVVQGWSSSGLNLFSSSCQVENLRVLSNGVSGIGAGIGVGDASRVVGCTISGSAAQGVFLGAGGLV